MGFDVYDPNLRKALESAHDAGWQDCGDRVEREKDGGAVLPWVVRRRMSVDRILAKLAADKTYDARIATARSAFTEAAHEMMQSKRREAASADYDDSLAMAVVKTTREAHRAHYDYLNALAAKGGAS